MSDSLPHTESGDNHQLSYHATLARLYALAGIHVFPCGPDKRPLIKNWENRATCDPHEVERLWRTHPNALVGLPCRPNGLAVLDVDCHVGRADGVAALKGLREIHGPLPKQVIVVRTPNSGIHFYFARPPEGLKTTAGKIAPGLDTRGDGGYVIAPGSQLQDERTWALRQPADAEELRDRINRGDLAEIPPWLLDLTISRSARQLAVRTSPSPSAPRAEQDTSTLPAADAAVGTPQGLAALRDECQKVREAREGSRNDTLNRACFAVGRLVAAGAVAAEFAESQLTEAGRAAGLGDEEIARTVESGLHAGLRASGPISAGSADQEHPAWPEVDRVGRPRPGYRNAVVAVQALAVSCQHDVFHRGFEACRDALPS